MKSKSIRLRLIHGISWMTLFTAAAGPALAQSPVSERLALVRGARNWAYQIQKLSEDGAVDALVSAAYDVVVIDPTRTDPGDADFPTAQVVQRLKASVGSRTGSRKVVIAYIDIGEAEDYRTYWLPEWTAPTATTGGVPDFLLTIDPDGWSGNYPVAFWDQRWKDIVIYDSDSLLNLAIDDGFEGIYMDWVEAYSNTAVEAAAAAAGKNPAQEMVNFIAEIRRHARTRDPDFLVIAQNSPELAEGRPDYLALCDALGQEDVFYSGGGDTMWDEAGSGDMRTPDGPADGSVEFTRNWFYNMIELWQRANKPILQVTYALLQPNIDEAFMLGRRSCG